MTPVQAPIVGREAELAVIRRFVGDHSQGPASLTIEGGAGIGKTTLWTQALLDARAAGLRLRTCRCSQADATWSFAGLGDLFDGPDPSELAALPAVQQDALAAPCLSLMPAAVIKASAIATGALSVDAATLNLPAVAGTSLAQGRFLNAATAREPVAVLGAAAAQRLGIDRIRPGMRIWAGGQGF